VGLLLLNMMLKESYGEEKEKECERKREKL
jgi:hypothetical protein